MPARPRDSQRSKVYAWENEVLKPQRGELTFDECRELVRRVWAAYRPGERPPTLADGRGTRHGFGSRQRINLPLFTRNRPYVLHKTAHSLLSGTGLAWHGPAWLRLYVELLARLASFQRAALLASARAAGLKVARNVPLQPRRRLGRAASLRRPPCRHQWEGTRLARIEQRRWGKRLMERRWYDEFHCRACGENVREEASA